MLSECQYHIYRCELNNLLFYFLKSLIYIQSKNKTTKDLYKINLHLTLVNNTIASEVNVLKFLLAYDYNLYTGITKLSLVYKFKYGAV